MPLIKPVLETQIFSALQKLFNNTSQQPIQAHQAFAKDLANAIDAYIKSATIQIPPGQVLQGVNAPGQIIAGAGGGAAPVVGSTTSPGTVTGATTAISPPALIN
jgi:hypothetical protein